MVGVHVGDGCLALGRVVEAIDGLPRDEGEVQVVQLGDSADTGYIVESGANVDAVADSRGVQKSARSMLGRGKRSLTCPTLEAARYHTRVRPSQTLRK